MFIPNISDNAAMVSLSTSDIREPETIYATIITNAPTKEITVLFHLLAIAKITVPAKNIFGKINNR